MSQGLKTSLEAVNRAEAEAVVKLLKDDYLDVRILPDGSIAALGQLLTTTAIYMGVTRQGNERRYCFRDTNVAIFEYAKLKSEDDQPTGWIARRPEQPCGMDNHDKRK